MIVDEIKTRIQPEMVIPKPEIKSPFTVKGWGKRRGENALLCRIPNTKNPEKPYVKGIAESEWVRAYDQLRETGAFTRYWFNENLPACANEGSCNFTTIGGIFVIMGLAAYSGRGRYERTGSLACEPQKKFPGSSDLPERAPSHEPRGSVS